MSVLEVLAPEGAVLPFEPADVRGPVESAPQRFSSAAARPDRATLDRDATDELAAELGTSERALRTARGMLQRHIAPSGEGQAGELTAALTGMRRVRLNAPGLMVRGRTEELSIGVALIADPLVLLAVGGRQRALHWSLLPGGPSVTARADALRFLRGLATGGQLIFQMGTSDRLPPVDFDGGRWEYEEEWRLFEDLATLEEWGGVTIPMPQEVSGEEATIAAQAASWARTRQVAARVTEAIIFTTDGFSVEEPDELRLHQDFDVELFGVEVLVGEGVARVKLDRVDRQGSSDENGVRYLARPAESEITFWLRAPSRRRLPPYRTQPDHVPAPEPETASEIRLGVILSRRSSRPLAEILAKRHGGVGRPLRETSDTRGLLNELRGD